MKMLVYLQDTNFSLKFFNCFMFHTDLILEEREFQNSFFPKQISKRFLHSRWYTSGKAKFSMKNNQVFFPFSGLAESMQWIHPYRQTIAAINGWVSMRNCCFPTKHQQNNKRMRLPQQWLWKKHQNLLPLRQYLLQFTYHLCRWGPSSIC